jgi:hypothetical protein
MKSFYKSNNQYVEDHHTFGKPLGPATPIKDVLGNFFGEYAEHMHKSRQDFYRSTSRNGSRLTCHKRHTRASNLAKSFILNGTESKNNTITGNHKDLFKMKKFQNIAPRTDTNLNGMAIQIGNLLSRNGRQQ